MKYANSRFIVLGLLTLLAGVGHFPLARAECDTEEREEAATTQQGGEPRLVPRKVGVSAASEENVASQSVWMRVKLNGADGILKGLARADFVAIKHNAGIMKRFARLERWARVKNEDYQTHLQAFDQANRDLIRQANRENLEGVTLAFFQLTTSCVNCHRVVRDHEELFQGDVEKLTHIVKVDTDYYLDGPQQARLADGTLVAGTLVAVVEKAGSYWVVLSEKGLRAFVAADAIKKIDVKLLGESK